MTATCSVLTPTGDVGADGGRQGHVGRDRERGRGLYPHAGALEGARPEEVVAGEPIPFSSKYGTRLYAVPSDYVPANKMSRGEPLPFPSCDVPVSSITYVPVFSPVTKIRSTCKITDVTDDAISIELIDV